MRIKTLWIKPFWGRRYTTVSLMPVLACLGIWSNASAAAGELTNQEALDFINVKGCNACHDVHQARLAPPFDVIAVRYAGSRPEVVEVLAQKIIHGGAGTWGTVPMVSHPHLSHEEARAIASWILRLNFAPPDR